MNRRQFLRGVGAFMILPGAGRVWKAVASPPPTVIAYKANALGIIPQLYDLKRCRVGPPGTIDLFCSREMADEIRRQFAMELFSVDGRQQGGN